MNPVIVDDPYSPTKLYEIRPFNRSLPIIFFRFYLLCFALVVVLWLVIPNMYLSISLPDTIYYFIRFNAANLCIVFGAFPALLLFGLDQKRERRFRKYRASCDCERCDPGERVRFFFPKKLIEDHSKVSFYLIRFTRVEHNTLLKFNFTIVENLYRVDSMEKGGEFYVEIQIPLDSILINGGTLLLTVRALQCHNYALMAIFDDRRMFYGIPQSIDWEV